MFCIKNDSKLIRPYFYTYNDKLLFIWHLNLKKKTTRDHFQTRKYTLLYLLKKKIK